MPLIFYFLLPLLNELVIQEIEYATRVWAGKDSPPFFLKMKRRATLDDTENVSNFLEEILQQNWRLALDAGLGVEEPPAENILIVVSAEVRESLLEACGSTTISSGGKLTRNQICVVAVKGTQAGDPLDWRSLQKKVSYHSLHYS